MDSEALRIAKIIVEQMMGGPSDIRDQMAAHAAAVAIIPHQEYVTSLPDFAYLAGKLDRNGNPYDSFAIRGLGPIPGQPVTATAEENLLKLPDDPFAAESVLHHEFAHAIMNLGFTSEKRGNWSTIYDKAVADRTFPGTFSMTHRDEYFAELSQSYFSVNNEIGGPLQILAEDPDAYAFSRLQVQVPHL